MRTIGIIPARKGSKGIKGKNTKLLNGIRLIEYTLKAAYQASQLNDIIISSDCEETLKIGENYKCITTGLRPEHLSNDKALTVDVIKHELLELKKKKNEYDIYILLQPTTPFRDYEDIDKCIEILKEKKSGSIISVADVGGNHPLRMKVIRNKLLYNYIETGVEDMRPRQELPKVYIRNGAIYGGFTKDIIEGRGIGTNPSIAYEMSPNKSINIDNINDYLMAEIISKST